MSWTIDLKSTEKGPWQNLGSEHVRSEDAWNYFTYLRLDAAALIFPTHSIKLTDYYAVQVRPV